MGRTVVGAMVALGLLATVPTAVLAAQPSCGDILTVSTTLTADLDCSGYDGTALTLGAKGITLDLNGHTLTGYTGDDTNYGVYADRKNVTVTNGTINNAGYSVYFYKVTGGTVSWLTINSESGANSDVGIYVYYGASNTIKRNTVNGAYYGIDAEYSASNTIKKNVVTSDGYAFYFYYETKDLMVNNVAQNSYYGFYDEYSGGQRYTGNKANGNSQTGFYLYCDEYGPVFASGNIANNNGDDGFYTYYCWVYPPGAPQPSVIKNNTANGNGGSGFDDYYSVGATFKGNTANGNGNDGMYLDYPGDQHILNNTLKNNADSGLELADNYGVGYGLPKEIVGNTVKKNSYGIYANYGLPNNVCRGNVVSGNTTEDFTNLVCK
jgi:parallel beta-helix repeat protein